MSQRSLNQVVDAIRRAGGEAVPPFVRDDDSLVLQLGFDSMKMALLSLSLEEVLGRAIALDTWIASCPDPDQLTVRSLCRYVDAAVHGESPSLSP